MQPLTLSIQPMFRDREAGWGSVRHLVSGDVELIT